MSVSVNANQEGQASNSNNRQAENALDDACVVCFKPVDIYSIGECDHPVCYECSTRMRVLCQQNECPICRQVLSKVIFTYEKLPYRQLEAKNRSEYYNKMYKIGFFDLKIQQAFSMLLDHPCPKCNCPPYRTFQGLANHVRKVHDHLYCDLCTENLKIFTFERSCYTQSELNRHRSKGDPDNKSHRGHPLCEYCNKRYLDRDELYRHLRRDHYFCHFCDADGCNKFYKDYPALAEHFRKKHYLCEEGRCATEQFVGAFASEIDYKAHVANAHGKSLNKQQAKQTRTLQLEITLGPRGRAADPNIANVRTRAENNAEEIVEAPDTPPLHSQSIDARNEEDFPSLIGTGGTNVSLVCPPPPSLRNLGGTSGLARTKENFPALGGAASINKNSNLPERNSTNPQSKSISSILKSPQQNSGAVARPTAVKNNTPGMVLHVSNRPVANNSNSQSNAKSNKKEHDFPALPATKSKVTHEPLNLRTPINRHTSSAQRLLAPAENNKSFITTKPKKKVLVIDDDILPSTSSIPMSNVSAKHRNLVDDYVSAANPNNFQKLKMVQKEESEKSARKDQKNVTNLTSEDFPQLCPTSSSGGASSWNKVPNGKKPREVEIRKSKVAEPPMLPIRKTNSYSSINSNHLSTQNNNQSTNKKEKKNKEKKANAESKVITSVNKLTPKAKGKNSVHQNNKNNNDDHDHESRTKTENDPWTPLGNGNLILTNESFPSPSGFNDSQNSLQAPPGFHSNISVNSVAKLPNNLTFTSSLGESYDIVPSAHTYTQPTNATSRNQKLVEFFKATVKFPEALQEFKDISQHFREGTYKPEAFYEHCQAILRNEFNDMFPELLALLPDISKQQALFLVHQQHLNNLPANQRKSLPKLEVCSTCKQVLLDADADHHYKTHVLKANFPALGTSSLGLRSNSIKK